jgi:hypothetical protein
MEESESRIWRRDPAARIVTARQRRPVGLVWAAGAFRFVPAAPAGEGYPEMRGALVDLTGASR